MTKGQRHKLGTPHHKYHRSPMVVRACLAQLRNALLSLRRISKKYNVPVSTLCDWKKRLREDPNYDPLDSRQGLHRRIFSDEQEASIASHIRSEYLAKKRLFTDRDCYDVVQNFYHEFHPDSDYQLLASIGRLIQRPGGRRRTPLGCI